MSTQTTNLGLTKPSGNEKPLVSVLNTDLDIIDEAVGDVDVQADGSLQDQIDALGESVSYTRQYETQSLTIAANDSQSVSIDVSLEGYTPIGIVQHYFSVGSKNLYLSNCYIRNNYALIVVCNRASANMTATITFTVLYKAQ